MKFRNALSIHSAIYEAGTLLGWDLVGEIIGKDASAARKYSDPDTGRDIKLGDAILIDKAILSRGGNVAPINNIYNALLFPDTNNQSDILSMISLASRECGEAIAAGLLAKSDKRAIAKARQETAEAITILTAIHKSLGG